MSLGARDEPCVFRDLQGLFTECVGFGENREVWKVRGRDDIVAKLETSGDRFQNISEHLVWNLVQDSPQAKWFAPVEWIGASGSVLFMKRTMPVQADQFPRRVPDFFTDLKRRNFGMLDGKFVCHDYGILHRFIALGLLAGTRKAEWWGEF